MSAGVGSKPVGGLWGGRPCHPTCPGAQLGGGRAPPGLSSHGTSTDWPAGWSSTPCCLVTARRVGQFCRAGPLVPTVSRRRPCLAMRPRATQRPSASRQAPGLLVEALVWCSFRPPLLIPFGTFFFDGSIHTFISYFVLFYVYF